MRVLGIDPGLTASGYGIIDVNGSRESLVEAGVIRPGGRDLGGRLNRIHQGMVEVLQEWRPEVVVIEELYSKYHHPRTAILMAHARGVVCMAVGAAGLSLAHYEASQVRRALTGHGRASARQVREMVCRRLGVRTHPGSDDMYDALALALCHAGRLRDVAPRPVGVMAPRARRREPAPTRSRRATQ
jgi:crossover junction endodeoxyribonuclease RuvC